MIVDRLLTAQQVADHFGIHIKTLYKLIRENRMALTFIRMPGNRIAFRPADVQRYLECHEVNLTGEGKSKKRNRKPAQRTPQRVYAMMTNEQAQEFFASVEKKVVNGFVELEMSPDEAIE